MIILRTTDAALDEVETLLIHDLILPDHLHVIGHELLYLRLLQFFLVVVQHSICEFFVVWSFIFADTILDHLLYVTINVCILSLEIELKGEG